MARLDLKIREACQEPYIEFYADGENLGVRVRWALAADGFDEVLPWPGGDYNPSQSVLGEQVRRIGAPCAIFLACGCGHFACSGVSANVAVSEDKITLSNFVTWRRVLAPVDPVVFDRLQYEEEVQRIEREVQAWHPPTSDGNR